MRKSALFVQGGRQGAYAEDEKLVANLQDGLGAAYSVQYLKMPHEDRPEYEVWKDQITKEFAALDDELILVGHSLGGSILLKYPFEETLTTSTAGLFLIAAPYLGGEDWNVSEYTLRNKFASNLPEELPLLFTTAVTTSISRL